MNLYLQYILNSPRRHWLKNLFKFSLSTKFKSITIFVFLFLYGCTAIPVDFKQEQHFKNYNVKIYKDVKSYRVIDQVITHLNHIFGKNHVLVVLDLDNTVMTSETNLGSDAWYNLQKDKLVQSKKNNKPDSQMVKCLYEDAIGLLYELGTQKLVEQNLDKRIKKWQSLNTVIALTSRAPRYRGATERELFFNNVDFSKNPLVKSNEEQLIFRFNDPASKRKISYIGGIMMTSGLNKGKMLQKILDYSGKKYKAIIFVDDSNKNVLNVKKVYHNNKNTMVYLFHYTKINNELTNKIKNQMAMDWGKLTRVLNKVFTGRKKRYEQHNCLWAK